MVLLISNFVELVFGFFSASPLSFRDNSVL